MPSTDERDKIPITTTYKMMHKLYEVMRDAAECIRAKYPDANWNERKGMKLMMDELDRAGESCLELTRPIVYKRLTGKDMPDYSDSVLVHADGGECHGTPLVNYRCPKCGIAPDMQSTEVWSTEEVRSSLADKLTDFTEEDARRGPCNESNEKTD